MYPSSTAMRRAGAGPAVRRHPVPVRGGAFLHPAGPPGRRRRPEGAPGICGRRRTASPAGPGPGPGGREPGGLWPGPPPAGEHGTAFNGPGRAPGQPGRPGGSAPGSQPCRRRPGSQAEGSGADPGGHGRPGSPVRDRPRFPHGYPSPRRAPLLFSAGSTGLRGRVYGFYRPGTPGPPGAVAGRPGCDRVPGLR